MPPSKIASIQTPNQLLKKFLVNWQKFCQRVQEALLDPECPLFIKAGVNELLQKEIGPKFLKDISQQLSGSNTDFNRLLNQLGDQWQQIKEIAAENKIGQIGQFYQYFWNVAADEIQLWRLVELLGQIEDPIAARQLAFKNGELKLAPGAKMVFNPQLEQRHIARLLRPQSWLARTWQTKHCYQLLPFKPNALPDLLHPLTISHFSQVLLVDPNLSRQPSKILLNSQKLVDHFQVRRQLYKLTFQKPLCQIRIGDLPMITVFDFGPLSGTWGNIRDLDTETYWDSIKQLTTLLQNCPAQWQSLFETLKKDLHKPQLSSKNFLPALAIIYRREAEVLFRTQLCQAHFYPLAKPPLIEPYYLISFLQLVPGQIQFSLNGQNATQLLMLDNQRSQLLALDDLNLWKKQFIQEEFQRVTQSSQSPLSPLQKEIYLALLKQRQEINPQWLWVDDD